MRRLFRRIPQLLVVGLLLAVVVATPVLAEDTIHTVQPGENLYRIALQYDVTIAALAQANNIANTTRIYVGQQLVIPDLTEAVENPLIAGDPTFHVVQAGETLANIANRYGLTADQLAQLNNIADPNRIQRGQTLTILALPPEALTQPEAQTAVALADITNATAYTVQQGETLAEIAQRFNITWPAIVQANSITDPNTIQPGQMLVIPNANSVVDLGIIDPSLAPVAGPAPTVTVGKQIIVSVSLSRIYAYEDGRLVRSALGSMGLPATPTITGSFTVQRKYESQIMSGPGYYLPNVQWISYFYAGYAIHGTYWHNNFGQPMSHGCVNLPNDEARWFYDFAPVGTPVLVLA